MDACIAEDTLGPFLLFLILVIPLIGFAIIPLLPLQLAAIKRIVETTWYTDILSEIWWSRWYSWVGGPIWR